MLNRTPVTLAYVKEQIKDLDESKPIVEYIKAYCKLSKTDADKLLGELKALNNPKISEENFIKIADFLPIDAEDLNKIFMNVSLTEEESNAILSLVKNY